MAEDPTKVNKDGGGAAPDDKNGAGNQNGADPTKTGADASGSGVDTSKFTEADWEKVYADKKLYEHPRFKGLTDQAKRGRELEEATRKAEEVKLAEEKKFEELATRKDQELQTWKSKAQAATVDNAIAIEAQKLGVVDVEAVTKLIDRSAIKLGDDGNSVAGVTEAVKALVTAKPYLVGKDNKNLKIGEGTNPADAGANIPTFKLSQLGDFKFYQAHAKEIDQAFRAGRIINDTGAIVNQPTS